MPLDRERSRPYPNPLDLVDFTRFYARQVEQGGYPFIGYDEASRWHRRIYRDPRVDVWLISWLPTQGTELHDHGGSSGSFTVVSGTLTETVVAGGGVRELARDAGASVGFGQHYVHDVRNASSDPAVSVHAYSPPLRAMTFYEFVTGTLLPTATVATDDPEPTAGIRDAS